MSDNLTKLVEDFRLEYSRVTEMYYRQGRELQSLQNAILLVSKAESLTDEEEKEISNIVNITKEWWCVGCL